MPRSHQLLLLAFAASVATAAEDDPVKAPYVEVGDCWSYQTEGFFYRGPVKEYEFCIARIDKVRDLIQGVATFDKGERELDATFSLDWGNRAGVNGITDSPPANFMKFPLRVGDSYPLEFGFSDSRAGVNAGRAFWKMKVVGWEGVTVAAGTFRAIKIEGIGRIAVEGSFRDVVATMSMWYVPEVNRYVKRQYVAGYIRRSEELTAYRLIK